MDLAGGTVKRALAKLAVVTGLSLACAGTPDQEEQDVAGPVIALTALDDAGAAALRYPHQGAESIELASFGEDGATRWHTLVHDGEGASPFRVATEGAVWGVVGHGGAGWQLRGIAASDGSEAWARSFAASPQGVVGSADRIGVWSDEAVLVVERATGAVKVDAKVPVGGGRQELRLLSDGRAAVLDIQRMTIFGPGDQQELAVDTFSNGRAAGERVAVWTDPERRTWARPHGQEPAALPVEGRVRRGAADGPGGVLVVPFHHKGGGASLLGVSASGELAWQQNLGEVEITTLDSAGPAAWVPFVVESAEGRALLWVEAATGRVQRGSAVEPQRLLDARRVQVGGEIVLTDGMSVVRHTSAGLAANTVPGARMAELGPRIGARGVWVMEPVPGLVPWSVLPVEERESWGWSTDDP